MPCSSESLMQHFLPPVFLFHIQRPHSPPHTWTPTHAHSHTTHHYTYTHVLRLQQWAHVLNYPSITWCFGPQGNCSLLLEDCTPKLPTYWTIHLSKLLLTIAGSVNLSFDHMNPRQNKSFFNTLHLSWSIIIDLIM